MIYEDTCHVGPDTGTQYTVQCYIGNATVSEIDILMAGAKIFVNYYRVQIPLPLADAETGAPIPLAVDRVQRIGWRGNVWAVEGLPAISRVHGEDHHVTYRMGGRIEE